MSKTVFLIGAGPAGSSLLVALTEAGYRPVGVLDTQKERAIGLGQRLACPGYASCPEQLAHAKEAMLVIVATPDVEVEPLARLAAAQGATHADQVWMHLAGALDETALFPLSERVSGVAACHPACAFPPAQISAIAPGTWFGVSGDANGVAAARELVADLKGHTALVPANARRRYHAAAVMASNLVVALLAEARNLLVDSGISPKDAEALALALANSALTRATELGLEAGLSGPVTRGDEATVQAHLETLRGMDQETLYRELTNAARRLHAKRTP